MYPVYYHYDTFYFLILIKHFIVVCKIVVLSQQLFAIADVLKMCILYIYKKCLFPLKYNK